MTMKVPQSLPAPRMAGGRTAWHGNGKVGRRDHQDPRTRPTWLTSSTRLWWGLAVAILLPLGLAAALLPMRDSLDGAVVGLVMLLPTALAAAIGGPITATVAVVAGSMTHNLVFTQPYMTLRVADATDVTGLAVHTGVAALVSLVVVREQRAARRAEAREEQAARIRLLEEVDRMRTAILGAVSHDLRTPLAAISAAASELQARDVTFTDADRAMLADTISEQARRLDRTVANLLDAGRLQAGEVEVTPEAVEAGDLVEECLATLPADAVQRVRIDVRLGTPPLWVDPVLVESALRNLVENALQHAPSGTPVEVVVAAVGSQVAISVQDQGRGLVGVDVATIFEPFHTRRDGGIGLGLTICRGFVDAHGGRLDFDSSDDGTRFRMLLPSAPEPAE